MDHPVRILIADDHPVVRDGLVAILGTQPDFQVIGEAGDGLEAVSLVERLKPNVLVLDMMMPGLSGFVGEFLSLVGAWKAASGPASLFWPGLVVIAATGVLLAAAYMLWMVLRVVLGKASEKVAALTDATPLANWWAHERAARIYDGPDEVHKDAVARHTLERYLPPRG